ncbi:MAG: YfhO family protein [Nitrospirae bacterium]|nr:YfhO family protein [Nitrospirota bacterium]
MFFCFMFCIIILIVASLDKMYGDYKCGTRRKPLLVNLSATLLMFFYAAVIIVWVTAKTLTAFYPIVIENLLRSPLLSNLLLNYNYKIGIQLILYSYFYDIFFYLFLASFLSRLLILWWFKSGRFLKERYGFIFLCVLMLMDFILMWSLYYPLNDIHDLRYSDRIRQNAFIGNVVKPTERIASFHKELKAPYKLEKINDKLKNKFGENPVFNPAAIYEEYNRQNYDSGFYYGLYDPGISYYAATVGKQSLNFHSSLFPDYFWDFDKALNKNRVEYYRQSWIALYDPYSKLADVAGLKYIFWYEPLTGKKFKLRDTYPVGNGYIYENTQAVPKAYLVSNLEYYDNRKRLLERMAEDTFDPLKTAVTEDKELSNVFTPNDNATGEVTLTKYSTNEILMKTHTDGKALLVVNDLYYPYWRAEVDGKETKIYRVNGVFRAVVVDSGSHGVVMKFYNTHFHKGIKISVAALILTITLLLAGIILRMKKK